MFSSGFVSSFGSDRRRNAGRSLVYCSVVWHDGSWLYDLSFGVSFFVKCSKSSYGAASLKCIIVPH